MAVPCAAETAILDHSVKMGAGEAAKSDHSVMAGAGEAAKSDHSTTTGLQGGPASGAGDTRLAWAVPGPSVGSL